jgi:Uma2 family endonuclease
MTLSRRSTPVNLKTHATLEDLSRVEGKAELVHGEIVEMPPAGDDHGYAGDEIFASLREYAQRTRTGRAFADNKGFRVHLPHRDSLSPDAAYYVGPRTGMRFLEGAPVFAVEVRSENDYGRAAEDKMKEKRADYFACGTLVVWDVDLLSEEVVTVYRVSDPDHPTVYRRGENAEAEPAVPGWRMAVDDLFEQQQS